MSKLENASGNLKEVLCAIADGKDVQYWASEYNKWFDFYVESETNIFDTEWLSYKWRIKPDAFEDFYMDCKFNNKIANKSTNELMRMAWDAAMEYKNENNNN